MAYLVAGNRKLGRSILHFDLPAGPEASCPGASEYCAAVCYARKGHYTFPSVQDKYAANLAALHSGALESALRLELDALVPSTVIRLHTSGDFLSAAYVRMWQRLAASHPALIFYAYTRSWRVARMLPALESLRQLANFTLWASADPTMPNPPAGWPTTRIVATFADAPGIAHCPEQTGKRADCASCGLCFNPRLRPDARLAFKLH